MITDNDTTPPEGEISLPADSTPFTWGDYRKYVLPVDEEIANSQAADSKYHQAQIELLDLKIIALNVMRELGPQMSQEKKMEVLERMATSWESIAGSSDSLVEAVTNAGDSITLSVLYRIIGKLPPYLLAELKKHLGLPDGETL